MTPKQIDAMHSRISRLHPTPQQALQIARIMGLPPETSNLVAMVAGMVDQDLRAKRSARAKTAWARRKGQRMTPEYRAYATAVTMRVWDICKVPYDATDPHKDGGDLADDRYVIRGYARGASVETVAKEVADDLNHR